MSNVNRTAKKIVQRFKKEPEKCQGYTMAQIQWAHREMGEPLDTKAVGKWNLLRGIKQEAMSLARVEGTARAEARRTRAAAYREKKAAEKAVRLAKKTNRIPTGLPVVDKALSGGIPAGKVAELHGMEEMPSAPTPVDPLGIPEMSVPDLKALAKERGIKGFAKMRKPELIEALLADAVKSV